MSEQRRAIIISTGMDNLPLLQKLQETPQAVGSMLDRVKGLYQKFADQKAAIEAKENDASLARLKSNLEQKAAANKKWLENQSMQYEIARGSIPENMQPGYPPNRRGQKGGTTGGMIASGVAGDIVSGASGHEILKTVEIMGMGGLSWSLGHHIGKYIHKLIGRAFTFAAEGLGSVSSFVPILGTTVAGVAANLYMRGQLHQMAGGLGTNAGMKSSEEILAKHLNKMIAEAVQSKQISAAEGRTLNGALGNGISGLESVQRDLHNIQLRSDSEIKEAKRVAEFREKVREKFAEFDKEEHAKWIRRQLEKRERIQSNLEEYRRNSRDLASEVIAQKQSEVAHYSGGFIPSLEGMAGEDFTAGLRKNYAAGGRWDLMRGSPFRGQAQELETLQSQYAWNVLHPGDPQNALMAGQKSKIDQITDAFNKAGIGAGAAFEKTNDHLANLQDTQAKILDALAKDGIVIKSN